MGEVEQAGGSIAGQVAVVIGAAGGIGRAVAARLGAAGCRLALVDLEGAALQAAARELGLEGALALPADITRAEEVAGAARAVAEAWGGADILVNAAGINTRERTLEDLSAEQWEQVIGVNLTGVFHCTRAFLPLMRRRGGGAIVTVVSTAAGLVSPGAGTHYCAAKRALLSLTESINLEQGKHGIRACALSPGEVDTPLVDRRPEPPSAERRAAMLRPADVAEAVYFVVSRPPRVTISDLVIWPSAQISGKYVV